MLAAVSTDNYQKNNAACGRQSSDRRNKANTTSGGRSFMLKLRIYGEYMQNRENSDK